MLASNNAKCNNGGLATSLTRELVAGVSGFKRPPRVQEERRTCLPPPGSASRVWWSAEFLWDADHQALESMFRTSSTQSYAKFGKPI
jgi:hypothetical protein